MSCARRSSVAASILLSALAFGAGAQEIRLGFEFQVNAFTLFHQRAGVVARNASSFVVVWQSENQDGNLDGVFARRFSSNGAALTGDVRVNAFTTGNQRRPAVAIEGDGDFVVVWDSYGQDGYGSGVFGRRFSSSGVAQHAEFQIPTKTVAYEGRPAVAATDSGDFVVVWQSDLAGFIQVEGRRFSSSGVPLGIELHIASYTPEVEFAPAVAMDADGDFVVTWSASRDNVSAETFARRFSSAGVAQWDDIQVNVYTDFDQYLSSVDSEGDGDFVVVWQSYLQDGGYNGIFARRFSSAGQPLTFELAINGATVGPQRAPVVAMDGDGDFVVSWQGSNPSFGAFARRFASTGVPEAPEFLANTTPFALSPAIASSAAGDFVVVWRTFLQDGNGYGLFGQRFSHAIVMDIDGNGLVQPLTDSLLVLRYTFGFRGATLTTGAVDLMGCARCNAAAIEAYLAEIVK